MDERRPLPSDTADGESVLWQKGAGTLGLLDIIESNEVCFESVMLFIVSEPIVF
jgi:hypothetical protein